jgi:hypothetical protein
MRLFAIVTYTEGGISVELRPNKAGADTRCGEIFSEIGSNPDFYSTEVVETCLPTIEGWPE